MKLGDANCFNTRFLSFNPVEVFPKMLKFDLQRYPFVKPPFLHSPRNCNRSLDRKSHEKTSIDPEFEINGKTLIFTSAVFVRRFFVTVSENVYKPDSNNPAFTAVVFELEIVRITPSFVKHGVRISEQLDKVC